MTENFILENMWIIWLIIAWTLPWKGVALWKASRNDQKGWFVALLIIQTLGVLEMIYLIGFQEDKNP